MERIIDISDTPARLKVRYDQLVIELPDHTEKTTPLAELAALVVSNPQVSYSHAVLAGLARNNGILIVSDEKHLPSAMMIPLVSHHAQAERFEAQARASLPLKKRLWQQIITAKITAQAQLLQHLYASDHGLLSLARRVKSGDSQNMEAQASRRYWPVLFNDPAFRREPAREDQNKLLNYGYAVLRAVIARGLAAAGLHPGLGIHHHHRENPFCLADDMIEPFRPIVDHAVVNLTSRRGKDCPLDKEAKAALIQAVTARRTLEGENRTLFDIASRTASSLANAFLGKTSQLLLPEISFHESTPENSLEAVRTVPAGRTPGEHALQ